MANTVFGVLALALIPRTLAFRDTSPFFLFSTADLPLDGRNAHIVGAASLTSDLVDSLGSACPSSVYIVVQQDGVLSSDFRDQSSAPRLASYMAGKETQIKSRMAVTEVAGTVDTDAIVEALVAKCGAEVVEDDGTDQAQAGNGGPRIVRVSRNVPTSDRHAKTIAAQDATLEKKIAQYASASDYTVIYTTRPPTKDPMPSTHSEHPYEMEDPFADVVRMELKRDSTYIRQAGKKSDAGLFEKYQFFTPGLFMAFSAMVPLIFILSVGLRALANLEVSYFAFSKEMGPTAQKKQ